MKLFYSLITLPDFYQTIYFSLYSIFYLYYKYIKIDLQKLNILRKILKYNNKKAEIFIRVFYEYYKAKI